jgi:hypothetical protein
MEMDTSISYPFVMGLDTGNSYPYPTASRIFSMCFASVRLRRVWVWAFLTLFGPWRVVLEKVLLTSLIYYQSLSFVLHVQNRIFEVPQLSNAVIFFVHRLFWRVVFTWRCRNWVYKVPQLSNMVIFVPQLSNNLFFPLTLLESDIRMT